MKDNGKFLYCYKMTHDTGFAPNPYHGILTLATCKPTIRRCAQEGYWISGWTSNTIQGKNQKFNLKGEPQKLIYLALVSKKHSIADYWVKYPQKRSKGLTDSGDNIYEPQADGSFFQHENGGGHGSDNQEHDLSGRFVLVCKEFYYFGVENALPVVKGFIVPRCKKIPLDDDRALDIIDYVKNHFKPGINPIPL